MRIIRKHSGFTTNSSGSSEWVLPETDPALEQESIPGEGLPSGTDPAAAESGTLHRDQPDTPPGLPAWGKPLISIGIVGFLVVSLFFLEKLVRWIWKKIKGTL